MVSNEVVMIEKFISLLENGFSDGDAYNNVLKSMGNMVSVNGYVVCDIMDRIIRLKGVTK